jgi:hypothetical protein
VGGCCVPIGDENACGSERRTGLCPSGAACVDGLCVPTSDHPCDAAHPDGLCPAGQSCAPPCALAECSPQTPYAHCTCGGINDLICLAGSCVPLDCSPQHTQGVCDAPSTFCSRAGQCIPNGTCLATEDCPYGAGFCSCPSTAGECLNAGFCRCDEDCNTALNERCDLGPSLCVRDEHCDNDNGCLPSEYCGAGHTCIADGACEVTADCLLQAQSQFCSVSKRCLPNGQCAENSDCGPSELCSCPGSSTRTCVADAACVCSEDCAPGYSCNAGTCELSGAPCDANAPASCVGSLWCCPAGKTCCPQNHRCTPAGYCIDDGTCVDDNDCPPGFTCVGHACVPTVPCDGGTCGAGETCSGMGGCLPLGLCAADSDCPSGEVCNALFQCEPAAGCGSSVFQATLVPPNMMVVLDRSSSMNNCITTQDPAHTRWNIMRGALASVLDANRAQIRFGVSTFPHYCPGSAVCGTTTSNDCSDQNCTSSCNWTNVCAARTDSSTCEALAPCRWTGTTCVPDDAGIATGNNRTPGYADVAVGDNRVDLIVAALAPPASSPGPQHPGGYTPTGRTLRNVAAHLGDFGLLDPADTTARSNYILLMTDGEANSDGGTYGVCDGTAYTALSRVNCALDYLRTHTPTVRTFMVGFVEVANGTGNCHAVHGGTSRCAAPAECATASTSGACAALLGCAWSGTACTGGVDETNCDSATATCFYSAQDTAELTAAFEEIAGRVAGCTYSLNSMPPDANRLFVYLDYQTGANPVRLERDPSHTSAWDFDTLTNQVTLYGTECNLVNTGSAVPIVILGCDTGGG